MKHYFSWQQRKTIPARYRIASIIIFALFLLSGVLASSLIAVHAANQKSAPHLLQKAAPNDSNGTLLWQYQISPGPYNFTANAPAVANGAVYFGSTDGNVYSLNANTGTLNWRYQLANGNNLYALYTPAVANGIVYVTSSYPSLDALNASNGSLLWQYQTGSDLIGAPVVANGVVYISSDDNYVYAINASNGSLLWRYFGGPLSPATVANGIVYFVSGGTMDAGEVEALNATTGTLLWHYVTNTVFHNTPVVANGIVYASSSNNYLYALNATTGSLLWNYLLNSCSPQQCAIYSPAVANGVVYINNGTSNPTYLYTLNANNGSLFWKYQIPGNYSFTTPAVANAAVYLNILSATSEIAVLNASSGSLLWSDQPQNLGFPTTPVVVNQVTYFSNGNGSSVYAFDEPPATGPQGTERDGGSNPSELTQCEQCAGDPVDTFSGNFARGWSDFSVAGRGVPLLFNRSYNAQGAATLGPLGYGWTDSYNMALTVDGSGNVTIQEENGSTVTFAPNPPDGYSAPPRVLAKLVQNGDETYTFTRKDQVQYIFNSSGQLTREIDRNGYVTGLSYQNNRLATVTDPASRSLTFTYGSNNLLASVTDPLNRSVSFQYDSNNNLIAATDVNGGITHFTYDSNHLMLTITDPNGGVLTNVYDSNARVISQTDAMSRKTTFSYGASSTTITDPNGNVSVDQYQNGLLISETKGYGTPQAATWSYTYDPISLGQTSITDPNGHVWTQTWDASGNLLSATDPLKRTTTYTYDILNDLTSMTDPLGITTTYTYDASGNLLSVSTPLRGTKAAQTTAYAYGDTTHPGDITAMTDPDGKTWSYTYDTNGDLASVSDPLGDKTTYQYNSIGWKTAQTSPKGFSSNFTYDAFGDTAQVTDALGHSTTNKYDANRNLVKMTDAAGHVTLYIYDADNELTQITRADGSVLAYGYDGDGNRTSYTDGLSHKTTYSYADAAFPTDMTATTDPLGRTTSYGYDKAGNPISLTNPGGQVTISSYDAANELTTISYSDGKTHSVTYTYDKDGQRLTMTDGTGQTTYSYNSLHQLIKSTDGAGSAVAYGYDLKGQLTSLTYPGGQKVKRTYDAAGRLKTVKDWLGHTTSYAYDADGNMVTETYPNGVKVKLTYDKNDQVLTITDSLHGTAFLSFTYTRNTLSLLASLQTQGTPQGSETYGYTSLNQVSTVNQPVYTYDKGDNLTQAGSATLSYDAANELQKLVNGSNTTTFSYDSQGNRVQETAPGNVVTTYTYDQANRLTGYSNSSVTAQYAYNGDGLRMSKTVGGTPEAFIWDIAESLPLLIQDGTTLYVTGPGGLPLEQVSGTSVLYYHQDQLGSTRALTNSTGTVVATYAYDAYGNITGTTGSATNPFQYTGQYRDAESGLLYLRARYYDAGTEQFLTIDPLVFVTQHLYAYVGDDPLNLIDLSGKDWIKNTLDIVGFAASVVAIGALVVLAVATAPEDLAVAGVVLATAEIVHKVVDVVSTAYTFYQFTQGKAGVQDVVKDAISTAVDFIPGVGDFKTEIEDFKAGFSFGNDIISVVNDFSHPSASPREATEVC